jgi:excisionase family DNA binding protein
MTGILTTHELANRLGVHTDAIEYMVKKGRIPAGQRVGRTNVWTEAEAATIQQWWAERERLNAGCCRESKNNRR